MTCIRIYLYIIQFFILFIIIIMTIHISPFFNFKVLKHDLTWLDEWHANLTKNLIREDEFLTISTFEGLKMKLNLPLI